MAKDIAKSIRLSREVFDYINGYRGNGFNEKFENIILDYQQAEKDLQARIKGRKKELELFEKQIHKAAEDLRKLRGLTWRVEKCMEFLDEIEQGLKDTVSQE